MREPLAEAVQAALTSLGVEPPEQVHLERPARKEHGDWSTNVALSLAKKAGRNPRELAQDLAAALEAADVPHVTKVEIAGPGFVNFHLSEAWLHDIIPVVLAAGADYGRGSQGGGERVLIEFVSANPTGPVHAGHARGACYGDSLGRVMDHAGYSVAREFYINDRGVQMQTFAGSLAARAAGEAPAEGGYMGQYIVDWAALMPEGADPLEWGYAHALADQRETLRRLGVDFDVWFSERAMVAAGAIDATLEDLRTHGVVDERDGAVWLRSTDYGDDKDRVLVKSDGEYTYLLPDIAYHRDKYARGWQRLINVWGADHHGYVPRMKAAMQALGHDAEALEVAITQMVRLERDGEEVKISKRSGDLVTLSDLLDEVGPDAVRLTYLMQSLDSPQTVDLGVLVQQSMDNPVFYVQMAHARLCSLSKVAAERGIERRPLDAVDLGLLTHERELDVLRKLFALPEIVDVAARERAPHKLTTWVRELAATVHGWYHDCPVLASSVDEDLRQARWWLGETAAVGLRVGLGLLGVSAPEAMERLGESAD